MKFLNISKLLCLCAVFSQPAYSEICENNAVSPQLTSKTVVVKDAFMSSDTIIAKNHSCENILITSGFSSKVKGTPYSIQLPTSTTTQPISLKRNFGSDEGNIKFTPKGARILEPGDYWADFSISLTNQSASQFFIEILLKQNKGFNQDDPLNVGSSLVVVPAGEIVIINGSGILKNVKKNTNLSLVAIKSGVGTQNADINNWKISLYKINK